ncbi:glycosyltransferase [Aeromonas sp. FDAARGOS 1416]|uniref:glycosyltransferase n=1 Tax=Aeromonas TaxID=642 RepID=UPI001C2414AB|nr:glycosyltransferase [Aeromonas sp. FDAARGOS 1416]QXB02311.1 glycosyltransferase [Aeromonas sp. FDAARGOS 1416]
MKQIAVNATALSSGGALTILRQFIAHAALTDKNYIIFSPVGVQLDAFANITYIEVDTKSWLKRIWWDSFGLKRYIKQHNFEFELFISLQNTSMNVGCQQLIYLHQPLPFSDVKYSFNKETVKFFLYKWFYKFFIFLFVSKETRFVVQTQWMKAALAQSGVFEGNISVFTPDIKLPDAHLTQSLEQKHRLTTEQITFFYPASSLFYKNHLLILNALSLLKTRQLNKKVCFSVTLSVGDYPTFDKIVERLGLNENVVYLGVIPYEHVIENYISADAVLFPSYIETFGLPLAEAGVLGKKIICADLPYSRDVLRGYQGASFLNYHDAAEWADEMECVIGQKIVLQFSPLSFAQRVTWKDFFDFI